MDIERVIDIQAPAETVWAVMSDVEKWSSWTASIERIEFLDSGKLNVGSKARVRQPRLPTAIWCVTEVENGRYFEWESVGPGVKAVAYHGVEEVQGVSRATLSIGWTGPLAPVIRVLFGRIGRRYVEMEALGLKKRSEAASAVGRDGGV